jgi:hypothetical protein
MTLDQLQEALTEAYEDTEHPDVIIKAEDIRELADDIGDNYIDALEEAEAVLEKIRDLLD